MMRFYALVFGAVSEFAITIIIFYYLGQWIDNKLGEKRYSTLLTVVGLVFGFARVSWTAYKLMQSESAADKKVGKEPDSPGAKGPKE